MSDVRPARFLGQAVDTRALQHINEKLAQLEQQMAAAKADCDVVHEEETAIKRKREGLLTQRNQSHQILGDLRAVKSRLDRIGQQIRNFEKETIDLTIEEGKFKEKSGVISHFELFYFSLSIFNLINYFPRLVSEPCR